MGPHTLTTCCFSLAATMLTVLLSCSLFLAPSTEGQPMATTITTEDSSEGQLPHDTLRKLAQALYERGDKVENRLSRKFLYNGNVTCNDGSVAGYYYRRNYKSKRWIVYLEGKEKTLVKL